MDTRLAKCLLLTKVLVADAVMTESERSLLEGMMNRLGLSPEERRRVFDLEGWDEAEAAASALPESGKRELLNELIDAASADGRLSPAELGALKQIASALGLDAARAPP